MEKFKIEIKSESSDNQECLVVIGGDLGISNIEKIKKILLEKIENFSKIRIKIKDVLFIDLSFLQLLYSLERSQLTLDKKITAEINVNEEFGELITKTGFKLKYGYE